MDWQIGLSSPNQQQTSTLSTASQSIRPLQQTTHQDQDVPLRLRFYEYYREENYWQLVEEDVPQEILSYRQTQRFPNEVDCFDGRGGGGGR